MPLQSAAFLLAPGAGASCEHPRMREFAALLGEIGRVEAFDYDYMREGRKRPDPLPRLIEAHRRALTSLRERHKGPIFLAGKSMGSRVGCHLSLSESVAGLICFGYPLCGAGDPSKMRDAVLIELRTPVLFVQGTRDPLCPLDLLDRVRGNMATHHELHVVEGGDHSLLVAKTQLKTRGVTQADVDRTILAAVASFVASV